MPFHRVSRDRSTASLRDVSRCRALIALLAVALFMGGFAQTVLAFQTPASSLKEGESIQLSVDWLMTQQADDGGFVGFSGESDPAATSDAVIALAAADHAGVAVDLEPAIDYLRTQALVYAQVGPGSAAKLVLALVASAEDPNDFEKVSPLAIVERAATHGQIGNGPYDTALGLLALAGAGAEIPTDVLVYVQDTQLDDGSWSFDGVRDPGAGDTNTTALMIQALVAVDGAEAADLGAATDFLLSLAGDTGGFPYQAGSAEDVNSTSLVLQALLSLGPGIVDPVITDAARFFLFGLQNGSGAFAWMVDVPEDNLFATLQAIPAISGLPLPVYPAPSEAALGATPLS